MVKSTQLCDVCRAVLGENPGWWGVGGSSISPGRADELLRHNLVKFAEQTAHFGEMDELCFIALATPGFMYRALTNSSNLTKDDTERGIAEVHELFAPFPDPHPADQAALSDLPELVSFVD